VLRKNFTQEIAQQCVECGQCADVCTLLKEIGESPLKIVERGAKAIEAFSCALCGACESACPLQLSPKKMFEQKRAEAVSQKEFAVDELKYLYPDRKNCVTNVYRRYNKIDYSDINVKSVAKVCFFPGCSMITYSPELTRGVYQELVKSAQCEGVWLECCAVPLEMLGLIDRAKAMHKTMRTFVVEHQIETIIVACANCYYALREIFSDLGVKVKTVYEVLDFTPSAQLNKKIYTIHDTCPDRAEGIFATQIREAFRKKGLAMVEMEHTKKTAICCGSGGQISHTRPDLAKALIDQRMMEARKTKADELVGCCLSCVLKLETNDSGFPVTHALNLLLDIKEDFKGAKARSKAMLEGPDGEEIWDEIMTD